MDSSTPPAATPASNDYLISGEMIGEIVVRLIQILLGFLGPEQAKQAIDLEYARQVKLAADATKVATDIAADAIEDARFGPPQPN